MVTRLELAGRKVTIRNPAEGLTISITDLKDIEEEPLFLRLPPDEALSLMADLVGYAGHCCADASDSKVQEALDAISYAKGKFESYLGIRHEK
jgi:hypothetical protein